MIHVKSDIRLEIDKSNLLRHMEIDMVSGYLVFLNSVKMSLWTPLQSFVSTMA